MPCFDVPSLSWLSDCWFPAQTNRQCARLQPGELPTILAHINTFFAAHVADPREPVGVAFNCPGSWDGTPMQPLWPACFNDENETAMLAGNLFCRVAISRSENWWCFNDPRLEHKPRRYVIEHVAQSGRFGI